MTTLLAIVLALGVSAPADSARSAATAAAAAPPAETVQTVIRQAIEAMGGETRLRGMKAVKLEAVGHSYWIDQSERPEGPWVTQYEQRTELRDLAASRLRQTIEVRSGQSPTWSGTTLIVSDGAAAVIAGGGTRPGRASQVDTADAAFALGPERILLTARDAADAALGPEEIVQHVRQQVVQFTWKQARVRLLQARYHALPDRLAKSPAAPKFHAVAEQTVVGEGPNRMVIIPIHGENGERMLMVHLPERRLLYTSDDIIKMRSGEYFMPSFLVDLTDAVARAGITGIDTAFGMHLPPTPWAEIVATLRRLRPPDTAASPVAAPAPAPAPAHVP